MKYRVYASLLSLVVLNGLYAMEQMQDEQQIVKGILEIAPLRCRFIGSQAAYFKQALGLEVAFTDLLVPICAHDENPTGSEPEQHYSQNWCQRAHPAFDRHFPRDLPLSVLKGKKQNDIIKLCVYGKAVELKCVSSAPKAYSNELVAFESALASLKQRTLIQGPNYMLIDETKLLEQEAIIKVPSTDFWGMPCIQEYLSKKSEMQLLE